MEEQLTGAEILIRSLRDLNITDVFGYTGAAILPVFDALAKSQIKVTVNCNEQSCTFSAAGYSRSNKTIGISIVTSGPAITNTLTAVADSHGDSIPLIVIAGQVPEHKLGTDAFQHINVSSIFKDAAKKVIEIKNVNDIEQSIKDAYYLALSGKPGPVIIDFPLDKQKELSTYKNIPTKNFKDKYYHEHHLSAEQCKDFFSKLTNAKKPLLYIGGGLNTKEGSKAIREFNNKFRIPCVNTLMAKGVIDAEEDYALDMLGMFGTAYANKAIQETDFFFAIGVRWDDRVAEKVGQFAHQADIAYIDINPKKVQEIRENRKLTFSCVGDANIILKDLTDYAKENKISLNIDEWQTKTKELKREWPLRYNTKAKLIQQAEVINKLNEFIDDNTRITTGVGNHQMFSAQYLKIKNPKSFITSGSFGTMGFALPSAIGVQIRHPTNKVIAIDGDSSIKMNFGELHTIGEKQLPIKVLLFNNHSEGMVYNLQTNAYNNVHIGTTRSNDTDFSKIAICCGFKFSRRVTEKKDIEQSLKEFMNSQGPSFLEVICDKEEQVFPKVPSGKQYKDMILGPHMKKTKYENLKFKIKRIKEYCLNRRKKVN